MSLHYVLDGYNILHQMPALANKSVDDGRAGLVQILIVNRPQGSMNNPVTVVFDGRPGLTTTQGLGEVRVIFTIHQSADDRIKEMVAEAKVKSNMIVVTDDRELQLYIRKLGSKVVGVQDFISRAKPIGIQPEIKGKGPVQTKPESSQKISLTKASQINKELEDLWLKKEPKDPTP